MPEKRRRNIHQWWEAHRMQYNIGLALAGLLSYFAYIVVCHFFIAPHNTEYEVTILGTVFQGIAYLCSMLIANVAYFAGEIADNLFNKSDSTSFTKRLFRIGYWFSFALPFSIPLLIIVLYIVG